MGLPPVTHQEVDRVRRSVLDVVRKNIPRVRKALDGSISWNNQQVRLFALMLNKVMPDLHHSFNEHSVDIKEIGELSIAELEEIAARADKDEEDVIELVKDKVLDEESEYSLANSESEASSEAITGVKEVSE
jgi:hypothetical protein